MISPMRSTCVGEALLLAVVVTAVVNVVVPDVGLVMAIVLVVTALFALAEGFGGSGAEAGHEAWAKVEAERKREALRRGR